MTSSKPVLVALIVLNAIVLLGQLWPEVAPPFARLVNVGFLLASLAYFSEALRTRSRPR